MTNGKFCSQSALVCFVWLLQTNNYFAKNINQPVFVVRQGYVLYKEWIEVINIVNELQLRIVKVLTVTQIFATIQKFVTEFNYILCNVRFHNDSQK